MIRTAITLGRHSGARAKRGSPDEDRTSDNRDDPPNAGSSRYRDDGSSPCSEEPQLSPGQEHRPFKAELNPGLCASLESGLG